MVISASKIVPTAVVAGAVLYWVWPCLFPASTGAPAPAKLSEIAASLLSPTIELPPERNPFQPAAVVATAVPQPQRNLFQTAVAFLTTHFTALGSPGKTASNQASNQASTPAANIRLVLHATSAHGNHRLAIINGRLYAEGDTLQAPAGDGAPPVITRILPYVVLLDYQGRTVELKYSGPSAGGGSVAALRTAAPARGSATVRAKKPGPGSGQTAKKSGRTA